MTKNFKRKEFACKDGCGLDTVKQELVEVLQDVRDHFDKPVVINSGLRCKTHNARVGGAPKSQHLLGTAADICIAGVTPKEVYDYLDGKYPDTYGIGLYKTFTHIDIRNKKARF